MKNRRTRVVLFLIAGLALLLLACETAEVVRYVAAGPNNAPASDAPTAAPASKPTRSPDDPYDWVPADTPRCSVGDPAASVVTGSITENGIPVAGERVQASSGPGAEPISDEPAESDENGNFEVTFVCDGAACNGAFWIWVVNADLTQVSPFVQFIFDDQCRNGRVDFTNP